MTLFEAAMLPPFDPWRTCTAMLEVARGSAATPLELARMQAQRLAALLRAAKRSALYRDIIGNKDPSTLRLTDLPVMHKHELMDQFSTWVTEPDVTLDALRAFMAKPENIGSAFQGRFMPWESSGSHGDPGIFVQDAAALAVYDALEYHRRRSIRRWTLGAWQNARSSSAPSMGISPAPVRSNGYGGSTPSWRARCTACPSWSPSRS